MFSLDKTQLDRLFDWKKEQDTKVAVRQKREDAYYGAIGGGYTYSFTPNSIGCGLIVKNEITGDTIDLTDYDSW